MGKPVVGPKTAAFIALMLRIRRALDAEQGMSLKPGEVQILVWGIGKIKATPEEREALKQVQAAAAAPK